MGTKVGNYFAKGHSSKAFKRYGERSSVGRAPDCDSGGRGFNPRRSPHFLYYAQVEGWFYLDCLARARAH